MKSSNIIFGLSALLFSLTFAHAEDKAKTFEIDLSHSNVGFTIKHLVSRVSGEFKSLEGEFVFDSAHPEKSRVKANVKAETIDTHDKKRDDHLRSADFFDVKKFPSISFESKSFSKKGDQKFELQGDLTLHGVTKPVIFNVEYLGEADDPWGNHRAGFTASTKINRKEFGIIWNKALDNGGFVLGDDVEINLNIEGLQKKDQPSKDELKKGGSAKKSA